LLERQEINIEEKASKDEKFQLTKNANAGIVGKVPRGLRNSKPPET
jgi:hypothetical protein